MINIKKWGKVTECTIEQRLISKNPYISLDEDDIISNDVQTNSVSETKINDTDNNRKDLKHNSVRYYTSKKEPVVTAPAPRAKKLQLNITYKIKRGPTEMVCEEGLWDLFHSYNIKSTSIMREDKKGRKSKNIRYE